MPSQNSWCYADSQNNQIGPMSFSELNRLAAEGSIQPDTYVIEEGGSEWRRFSEIAPQEQKNENKRSRTAAFFFGQKKSVLSNRPPLGGRDETKEIAPEEQPKADSIKEYRRTCRVCGKVWHSLVKRENQIKRDTFLNACQGFNYCCNPGASLQANRNISANESEISRLRKCPECQSTNYSEEIIEHDQ